MKDLNYNEIMSVSGGTQNLVMTFELVIDGIPEKCIEQYYLANKDNLAAFNLDPLESNIVKQCPDMVGLPYYSIDTNYIPVSILLQG